jgi:hypothetical protein
MGYKKEMTSKRMITVGSKSIQRNNVKENIDSSLIKDLISDKVKASYRANS